MSVSLKIAGAKQSGLQTRITMTEGPTRCADPKSRSGAEQRASRDIIGVMTCPQMIHSCPAWVYKSNSNS